PVAARPRELKRRDAEVPEHGVAARDRELGADEHHVHGQAAAALGNEVRLCRSEYLRRGFARLVRLREEVETLGVDPDGVAHRFDLLAALDRAREVELDV